MTLVKISPEIITHLNIEDGNETKVIEDILYNHLSNKQIHMASHRFRYQKAFDNVRKEYLKHDETRNKAGNKYTVFNLFMDTVPVESLDAFKKAFERYQDSKPEAKYVVSLKRFITEWEDYHGV